MSESNLQQFFDDFDNKVSVCEFLCVKSDTPPIHSKPKSSSTKINTLKQNNPQEKQNREEPKEIKINSVNLKSAKKRILKRKQFNEKSEMQTLSKTRNTYKNAEHGLISKFMKNLSSDSDKTLMNQHYINGQFLLENGTQSRTNQKYSDVSVYNILCKPKKDTLKKKKNWFKEFIQEKKQKDETFSNDNIQDSLQIVDKSTPGPGKYNIAKEYDTEESSQKNFGSASRFSSKRPITALVDYGDKQKNKKILSQDEKSISFGTLKKNHRSTVRKVQYCDWYRSHCCENISTIQSQLDKKAKKKDPNFVSRQQRFKMPSKNYTGPDYYLKVFKKQKNDRAFSNFNSTVQKSDGKVKIDERDFLAQQKNTIKDAQEKQKLSKKLHINENEQKYQFEYSDFNNRKQNQNNLKAYIPDQERKNTGFCTKRRKLPEYPFHKPEKNKTKSPSPTTYSKKKHWGISSFNVRFQPLLS